MKFIVRCCFLCHEQSMADNLNFLLSRTTRPMFDEDVDENLKDLYELIDPLEYPDLIYRQNTAVYCVWNLLEKKQLDILEQLSIDSGIDKILINIINQDADCADDESEVSGLLFIAKDGTQCVINIQTQNDQVEIETLKRIKQLPFEMG